MRLAGKTALITGGSSGIGEAAAHRFVAEGAAVVLVARRRDELERVCADVARSGGRCASIVCYVTQAKSCEEAVRFALDTMGGLDILFNNAGVIHRDRTTLQTSIGEWDETFDVNVKGTFLMSRAALPSLMEHGSGSIINNASYLGLAGGRGVAAYAASKAAVVGLTRSMALDHAAAGVRVNCVCAGSVDTPMLLGEMEQMGGEALIRPQFEAKHPLGRIATADEVASAVVYLASDEAGFVTGVALPVDGGLTAS